MQFIKISISDDEYHNGCHYAYIVNPWNTFGSEFEDLWPALPVRSGDRQETVFPPWEAEGGPHKHQGDAGGEQVGINFCNLLNSFLFAG